MKTLCEQLEQEWNGCGWAEALPLRIRDLAKKSGNFRTIAESFLKDNPDYFKWIKELPTKNPCLTYRLRQSLVP